MFNPEIERILKGRIGSFHMLRALWCDRDSVTIVRVAERIQQAESCERLGASGFQSMVGGLFDASFRFIPKQYF